MAEGTFYKNWYEHNPRNNFGNPVYTIESSGHYDPNEVEAEPSDYDIRTYAAENPDKIRDAVGSVTRWNQLQNYPENIPTSYDYSFVKQFPAGKYGTPYHRYESNIDDMEYIRNQGYPTVIDQVAAKIGEMLPSVEPQQGEQPSTWGQIFNAVENFIGRPAEAGVPQVQQKLPPQPKGFARRPVMTLAEYEDRFLPRYGYDVDSIPKEELPQTFDMNYADRKREEENRRLQEMLANAYDGMD